MIIKSATCLKMELISIIFLRLSLTFIDDSREFKVVVKALFQVLTQRLSERSALLLHYFVHKGSPTALRLYAHKSTVIIRVLKRTDLGDV